MDELFKVSKNVQNMVICGHSSPDGDCIGACFALAMAYAKLGKKTTVLLEEIPQRFAVIPGSEFLYTGELDALTPDLFVALDCGDVLRFTAFSSVYERAAVTFCVDHHISNEGFALYNHIEPNASSTCEIIYKLIKPHITIDKDIAACLYAGIVDDTGGFCHASTSPFVHEIAGELIKTGIPFTKIHNEVKNTRTLKEITALKLAVDNMVIDGALAYSVVSAAQMTEAGVMHTDFESIAEFLLNIKGIRLSFFVYEKPRAAKISFRSKHADVSEIAAKLGGGGHKFAAGALVKQSTASETADFVLNAVNEGLLGEL